MKCLDKKRIKMKHGETLALNERIMLSLVSTGVRSCSQIARVGMIFDSGRKSFHCLYDICLSNCREIVLHPRFNEWGRFALSLVTAQCLLGKGSSVLCFRDYSRAGAYA